MDIKKTIARFSTEEQKKLAAARSAEGLSKIAAELGRPLDGGEAEAVFAAFYPVRGKEPIDEDDLAGIIGGYNPKSTGRLKGSSIISPDGRF